jgi:hypothetical protein
MKCQLFFTLYAGTKKTETPKYFAIRVPYMPFYQYSSNNSSRKKDISGYMFPKCLLSDNPLKYIVSHYPSPPTFFSLSLPPLSVYFIGFYVRLFQICVSQQFVSTNRLL